MRRTVLITGASSGIGRAIAIIFAREGWNIVGHYFSSEDKIKELEALLKKQYKVNCNFLKADLASEKQIQNFILKLEGFTIDSLINNAGSYLTSKHFSDLGIREITDTFLVNTFAPIVLSGNLFMSMKERRFGRIVSISSIAAKYGGSAFSLHYGCAKRALEGITKTLAREGAKDNVLVNTVRPGVIDTDFHKRFPKDMKKRIALIPMGRMGQPVDIAQMVYYLGSDKNEFITNEIITVAGGE